MNGDKFIAVISDAASTGEWCTIMLAFEWQLNSFGTSEVVSGPIIITPVFLTLHHFRAVKKICTGY